VFENLDKHRFLLARRNSGCIPLLFIACYTPSPPHPVSSYFIPFGSKYSPQHPILRHPHSLFFPHFQIPSFSSAQHDRKPYRLRAHIKQFFMPEGREGWLRPARPRGQSSSPGRVKNFLFSTSSRPALGSTQTPIQRVPGLFLLG
jgi:hypothetical protein